MNLKPGRSEKGTKFLKIFHLKFDVAQSDLGGRFFQILCPSQNVQTLLNLNILTRLTQHFL